MSLTLPCHSQEMRVRPAEGPLLFVKFVSLSRFHKIQRVPSKEVENEMIRS
jgi:hypothetical protein